MLPNDDFAVFLTGHTKETFQYFIKNEVATLKVDTWGGDLYIFWVRGREIGKGIDFHDFGIRNGIDSRNFGIRNDTDFYDFGARNSVEAFSEDWYKVGYIFWENWCKVGHTFWENWYKERVCFRSFDGTSLSKIWSSTPPGVDT